MKICHNRRGKWEYNSVSICIWLHTESGTYKDNALGAEAIPDFKIARWGRCFSEVQTVLVLKYSSFSRSVLWYKITSILCGIAVIKNVPWEPVYFYS